MRLNLSGEIGFQFLHALHLRNILATHFMKTNYQVLMVFQCFGNQNCEIKVSIA